MAFKKKPTLQKKKKIRRIIFRPFSFLVDGKKLNFISENKLRMQTRRNINEIFLLFDKKNPKKIVILKHLITMQNHLAKSAH